MLVQEANSENCLDFIFAAPLCKKVIIVPDTNYITSAIRKFLLDMPSPGSFQNIGLLIWAQQGLNHVKPCGSNWVKIKGAQLKINLHSPIAHWMLIKNGKRTMMIRCILTELLECKIHEKCLCLLMSALFGTLISNNSVRKHQITMIIWQFFISIQCTIGLCKLIFNRASWILTQFEPHGFTRSEPSWPQI